MGDTFLPDMADGAETGWAKLDFDLAHSDAELARWARKYARAMFEELPEGDGRTMADLREEIVDLEGDLATVNAYLGLKEGEVSDLEDEVEKLKERIAELEKAHA